MHWYDATESWRLLNHARKLKGPYNHLSNVLSPCSSPLYSAHVVSIKQTDIVFCRCCYWNCNLLISSNWSAFMVKHSMSKCVECTIPSSVNLCWCCEWTCMSMGHHSVLDERSHVIQSQPIDSSWSAILGRWSRSSNWRKLYAGSVRSCPSPLWSHSWYWNMCEARPVFVDSFLMRQRSPPARKTYALATSVHQ